MENIVSTSASSCHTAPLHQTQNCPQKSQESSGATSNGQRDRAAGALGGDVVALGNITRSAATDELSDVVRRLRGRRLRYAMQETVGQILTNHRTSACQKVPSYGVQNGDVSRGISKDSNGRAHFHGVGSCGDVWNCPVCASRIASSRREEIQLAMSVNRKQGGSSLLVTFTFPHYREDVLKLILAQFLEALRKAKSWRGFKRARESVGYFGQIRALEVTHSNANGWHPHCHEVWFLDGLVTPEQVETLQSALFAEWRKACLKVGLPEPSREFGVDVQYRKPEDSDEDDAAGAYISKWGSELTYSHMKQGKKGSRSPWSILADLTESYTYSDAKLFREYSEAFKGRAQLFWSRGLKDRFNIEEITDEELSDRPEKEIVRDITAQEWSAILKTKSRPKVLEFAEFQPERLDELIRSLVDLVNQEGREKAGLRRSIQNSTDRHIHRLLTPDNPGSDG